jgi:hypothetical protein
MSYFSASSNTSERTKSPEQKNIDAYNRSNPWPDEHGGGDFFRGGGSTPTTPTTSITSKPKTPVPPARDPRIPYTPTLADNGVLLSSFEFRAKNPALSTNFKLGGRNAGRPTLRGTR